MEHRSATTGAANRLNGSCRDGTVPVLGWLLLVMPQRQPVPWPGVKTQHRFVPSPLGALVQEPGVQSHLFSSLQLDHGQQQALGADGLPAG